MNLIKLIKEKKRFFLLIFIPLLLSLVLWIFFSSRRQAQIFQVQTIPDTANLYLSGPANVSHGDSFSIELYLNTGGSDVSGVDVIIDFNESLVQLKNPQDGGIIPVNDCGISNPMTCFKTFAPIIVDGSGDFDASKVVNEANNNGRIAFGAVTFDFGASPPDVNGPVNGENIKLADLNFTAGFNDGTVIFNLEPFNSTDDTNVISYDGSLIEDILLSVQSLTLTIGGGPSPSPSPSSFPSPSLTPTPSPSLAPTCLGDVYPSPGGDRTINFLDLMHLINNYSSYDNGFDILIFIINNYDSDCP